MSKPTQITIMEVMLITLGLSLLFTSLILMGGLFFMDALYAGSSGFFALALVYLLNRF